MKYELVDLGGALGQGPPCKLTQDVPGTVPELGKSENLALLTKRVRHEGRVEEQHPLDLLGQVHGLHQGRLEQFHVRQQELEGPHDQEL